MPTTEERISNLEKIQNKSKSGTDLESIDNYDVNAYHLVYDPSSGKIVKMKGSLLPLGSHKPYPTLSSLPSPTLQSSQDFVAFVHSDPNVEKNGYYVVENNSWQKKSSEIENEVNKANTTKGVSGKAVYEHVKLEIEKTKPVQPLPDNAYIFRGTTPPLSVMKSGNKFNFKKSVGNPGYYIIAFYLRIDYNELSDLNKKLKISLKKLENSSSFNTFFVVRGLGDWNPANSPISITSSERNEDGISMNIFDKITNSGNENFINDYNQGNYLHVLFARTGSGLNEAIIDYDVQAHFEDENADNIASGLTESLKEELNNEIKSSVLSQISGSNIICVGDSLTAGAGSNKTRNKASVIATLQSMSIDVGDLGTATSTPYPKVIQQILGQYLNVVNLGVGGENINTIAARQGAAPAIIQNSFILPRTAGNTVEVANINTSPLLTTFDHTSSISPLLQGNRGVNPCYVEGIECVLSYQENTQKYFLTRTSNGSRNVSVPAKTTILMNAIKKYRNPKAAVIWCWQNGGYSDTSDLIVKLEKIVQSINTKHFVLVGVHTGNESSRQEQEKALEQKFGAHFFNWRNYVSSNALYDFGITPTTDANFTSDQLSNGVKSDQNQMNIGALPSSLWSSVYGVNGATGNDATHMNAAGYIILGYKVVERLKLLGL